MTETNKQILLASRPTGWVEEANFKLVETPVPQIGDGQILVRNHFLSLDPYMRGRMSDVKSYAAPVKLGDVMIGGTAGEVRRRREGGRLSRLAALRRQRRRHADEGR
jgi:NADPH-dependent curcumin reductase CurA